MFPDLLPLTPSPDHLTELGEAMTDGGGAFDNGGVPAGFTYLGQFVDHDITFDPTALQEMLIDPQVLENFRTPMLDLDCSSPSPASGVGDTVPIPSDWIIDWRRFFELGEETTNQSRSLDPFLAPTLHALPGVPALASLAVRNLLRGRSLGLPPGQSVARFLNLPELTPDEIEVTKKHQMHIESPLWYYVLTEAQVTGKGNRLGKVGSTIVAQVFRALLQADSSSYVRRKCGWTPSLPAADAKTFTMADLLRFVDDINPIGE